MSYQVLARKWRPNVFAELVGQEHVVAALTNALDNQRLHHAYLFTGTRGVGKTTIARIFSKSLNCEEGTSSQPCGVCGTCREIEQGNYVDLLEIDAASRTKVEDTRELLDNVQYKPSRGEYKVYLIDEVHMLSKHSFNALLKTLEEPPPHVKFLLATTDPQKLPVTILSRCLQFNLKALSREQIQGQLSHILEQESIPFEPGALSQLAKAANGSMRDALSLTDQAIAQGNNSVAHGVVADMLGLMDKNQVLKLAHALLSRQADKVMKLVEEMAYQGPDFNQLLGELMAVFHQVALTQFVPDACKLESDSAKAIYTLAKAMPAEQVQLYYQLALQGRKDIAYATDGRSGFEMVMLRMLAFQPQSVDLSAINSPPDTSASLPASSAQPAAVSVTTESQTVDEEPGEQLQSSLEGEQQIIEQQAQNLRVAAGVKAQKESTPEEPLSDELLTPQPPIADEHLQEAPGNMPVFDETPPQYQEQYSPDTAVESNDLAAPQPAHTSSNEATSHTEQPAPQTSSTASLLALKQALETAPQQDGGNEEPGKKPEATEDEVAEDIAPVFAPEPSSHDEATTFVEHEVAQQASDTHESVVEQAVADTKTEVVASDFAGLNPVSVEATVTADASDEPAQALAPPWDVTGDQPPAFLETLAQTSPATQVEKGAAYEQLAPPWNIENSDHFESVSFEKAGPVEEASGEFDPTAHLEEQLEVEVDFDVPAFLPQGDKVISAHQLDTWSHMIESMPISALTKQLALHGAYVHDGNTVTLTLPQSKQHLNTESAYAQLQQVLRDTLKQDVSLQVVVAEPKNTPFAVQQKINQVRQHHAEQVVQQDEQIGLLRQTFAAAVVPDSIKPR